MANVSTKPMHRLLLDLLHSLRCHQHLERPATNNAADVTAAAAAVPKRNKSLRCRRPTPAPRKRHHGRRHPSRTGLKKKKRQRQRATLPPRQEARCRHHRPAVPPPPNSRSCHQLPPKEVLCRHYPAPTRPREASPPPPSCHTTHHNKKGTRLSPALSPTKKSTATTHVPPFSLSKKQHRSCQRLSPTRPTEAPPPPAFHSRLPVKEEARPPLPSPDPPEDKILCNQRHHHITQNKNPADAFIVLFSTQ